MRGDVVQPRYDPASRRAGLGWPSVDTPATLWHRIDLLEFLPTDPATQGPAFAVDRLRSTVEQHPDSHLDFRQPRFSA
jgi:hypothetical protein